MEILQLERRRAGLLVIDVQDALVAQVDHACEAVQAICCMIRGCDVFKMPLCVTEQYPKGLGATTYAVKASWGEQEPPIFTKTSFSALADEAARSHILSTPVDQWILVGLEAHICILQTAKDLLRAGRQVIVLNDAISSRSIFDFSTAIAELRDLKIRVTSVEAALFELLGDASVPEFKAISQLIR